MFRIKEIINDQNKKFKEVLIDNVVKNFKVLQLFNPFNEKFFNFRKKSSVHFYHFQCIMRKVILLKMNQLDLAVR